MPGSWLERALLTNDGPDDNCFGKQKSAVSDDPDVEAVLVDSNREELADVRHR